MNLAVDLHDTLSYAPAFFRTLLQRWPGRRYIVSGTPSSDRAHVNELLRELGIGSKHYDDILLGFEYDKAAMDARHFERMRLHKLRLLQQRAVGVYFDDNPLYADYIRNFGILVFCPALSEQHLAKFADADPYFTSNLQRGLFARAVIPARKPAS